jgi:hypothetical protein
MTPHHRTRPTPAAVGDSGPLPGNRRADSLSLRPLESPGRCDRNRLHGWTEARPSGCSRPAFHVRDEVVDDVAVVPGEAVMNSASRLALEQRRQLERGDPPFGAPHQGGHIRCRASPIVSFRYVAASPGVNRSSAARVSVSPRPPAAAQRQRGINAAGDHQMQLPRQMVEQEYHPLPHLRGIDDVVVIEHQQMSRARAPRSLSRVVRTDSIVGG